MKKRAISVLCVLILTFFLCPISASAAPSYDPYTALGDSITAGYTFEDGYISSYVQLSADALGISTYRNDAVLGMDSGDLCKLLYYPDNSGTLAGSEITYYASADSQGIRDDVASANLITVAIGSNDLIMTMVDMIYECIYPGADTSTLTPEDHVNLIHEVGMDLADLYTFFEDLDSSSASMSVGSLTPEDIPDDIEAMLEGLKDLMPEYRLQQAVNEFKNNWDQIINKLGETGSTLAVIGYYNPYPMLDQTITLPSGEELNLGFQCYIDQMNAYISGTSGECGVANKYIYVDVSSGIETCPNFDPHPTEAGHEEIARRLVAALQPQPTQNYNIPVYTIEAEASEGGSITPNGITRYVYGSRVTYTITPDEGYEIISIVVDGEFVDIAETYTFEKVTSDHSIYVLFANSLTIDAAASEGGSITPYGVSSHEPGSYFTYTITPDVGYEIISIVVDGEFVDTADTYTFENIKSNHSIYVLFAKNPFTDIVDSDWFYDAVMHMFAYSFVNGITDTEFAPNMTTTRAMIAAILYRMEDEPDIEFKNAFNDVAETAWYSDAVIWASYNGILSGYGNAQFGPDDEITREQLVTALYNYAKYKGYDTNITQDLSGFTDASKVSAWAENAMEWAFSNGLICGNNLHELDPDGAAVRAAIATIIYRFIMNY